MGAGYSLKHPGLSVRLSTLVLNPARLGGGGGSDESIADPRQRPTQSPVARPRVPAGRGPEAGRRAAAHSPPRGGPSSGPPRSRPLPAAAELNRSGLETMRRLPLVPLLPLQLALLVAAGAPEAPVSAPQSLVWGPGLRAGVVLPVRYFYLQAVNSEGQNLTRSPPGSVRPRASLAQLPAPLRPRRASPPRPRLSGIRPPPAWRPSPESGHFLFSPRSLDPKAGGSCNKSLLNE